MALDKHLEKTKRKTVSSIIDNRTQKMKEIIQNILPETNIAKFAVGYFFISGFETLKNEISQLDELYILMGNVTDSKTVEQLAQGYYRLEIIKNEVQTQKFQTTSQKIERKDKLSEKIVETISYMDQSDDNEEYLSELVKMIEENRLHIRIYTKGTFHAKAYLFGLKNQKVLKGYALVGSSNLSMSGIEHNTELNLLVPNREIYEGLNEWFDEVWSEAADFDSNLLDVIKKSWALNQVSPYDLYIKTIYEIVKARTEIDDDVLLYYDNKFPDLLEYQEVAFKQAIKILNQYSGVFIADVVGLGKTFIGTALLKYYQMKYHTSAIIVCPPSLKEMWEFFKNRYGLSAKIITTGELSQTYEDEDGERIPKMLGFESNPEYQYFDIILIDESHHFRNNNNVRYEVITPFAQDRKVILLTATPQNNTPWDLFNQIRLFHPNNETLIPIEGGNLKKYFSKITKVKYIDMDESQKKERSLNLQKLLRHVLIRRPRSHIEKYYAEQDDKGNKYIKIKKGNEMVNAYFPKRNLETWTYSIDSTYNGVYDKIYDIIGHSSDDEEDINCLNYSFYSLGKFLLPEKKEKEDKKGNKIYANLGTAGKNLRGIIRTLLFKRFESSVHAFRETIKKLLYSHQLFIKGLKNKEMLVGKESQKFMKRTFKEFKDIDFSSSSTNIELNDKITKYSNNIFDINDFQIEDLINEIEMDIEKLQEISDIIKDITPNKDDKLQKLKEELSKVEFRNRKILIFSQFIDTAKYIHQELGIFNHKIQYQIDSSTKKRNYIIARFAPYSNPEIVEKMKNEGKNLDPIQILISTDVLSEGLNLQDSYTVINYDLHWNPVKLIQRIGRIDRIGTLADQIFVYNFLPERELEEKLGIHERLHARIQEIQDVIGEDFQILDHTEKVNPDTLYVIYGGTDEEKEELLDSSKDDELLFGLNEAEELIRKLERENKEYIEYIKSLPKGLRSGKINAHFSEDLFFTCFQSGPFMKFYLRDIDGNLISDDLIKCLNSIKCEKDELSISIPKKHNKIVQELDKQFKKEVRKQKEELHKKSKISDIQRKITDKLYSHDLDDDILNKKIKGLSTLFEIPLPERISKQLKKLYNEKLEISEFIDKLSQIYTKNRIPEIKSRLPSPEILEIPRVITSMYLKRDEK